MHNRLLAFSLAQAAFGGFGDVLSNTLNLMNMPLKEFFNESIALHYGTPTAETFDFVYSVSAAMMFVGLLIGFIFMGNLMDALGRRETAVILRSTIGISSGLLMILGHYTMRFEFFVVGHLLAGVVLAFKVVLVIFVAECTPDHHRGMTTMMVNSGASLLVCIVTPLCLPTLFGSADRWTMLPLIGVVLATLHLLAGLFFPQSPKQLYIQNHDKLGSEKAIRFFHGRRADISAVMKEYELERLLETHGHASTKQVLQNKTLRWSLWLVLLLSFVPPVSALNVKSQYLSQILSSYGMDQNQTTLTMLLISLCLLPLLFLSPLIIDRIGRRPLFIAVCLLCTFEWMGLGIAQIFVDQRIESATRVVLGVGGVVLGQSATNMGLLVMAPILLSEICPHNSRAATTQISQVVPMFLAIAQVAFFNQLVNLAGSLFFFFFALLAAGLTSLVYLQLPETKALPVDRLVRRVSQSRSRSTSVTPFFHPVYGSTDSEASNDSSS